LRIELEAEFGDDVDSEQFTEWDEWSKMELDGWFEVHLFAKTAIQLIR
jgi:hypothetical protein